MSTARLRRDVFLLCVSILLALSMGVNAQTEVIDPGVEIMIRRAAADEQLAVIVRFHNATDVRDSALRQVFERLGASDIRVLWIIHSIAAKVPARAIPALASLAGVQHIRLDEPITLPPRSGLPKPENFEPSCAGDDMHNAGYIDRCIVFANARGDTTATALVPTVAAAPPPMWRRRPFPPM